MASALLLRRARQAALALGLAVTLAQAAAIAVAWSSLPPNLLGLRRELLWLFPLASGLLLALPLLLRQLPLELIWQLTPDNRKRHQQLAALFITALSVFFVLLLGYLCGAAIWAGLTARPLAAGAGLIAVAGLVPLALVAGYVALARQL